MRPGGVHCPYVSILECDSVEIVEEGVWGIDLVSVWKDLGDLEVLVDHADVDFFDLGTKLCQTNKSVSSSGENMGDRVDLPAKSSSAKL